MSYESAMLTRLAMPSRAAVEKILLRTLVKHGGTIAEFGSNHALVDEIADEFALSAEQRTACLETIYRKEGRLKKSLLFHRLLYRAADSLAKSRLISRPTVTLGLTGKREWMLTEKGIDRALVSRQNPSFEKESLQIKSLEAQKLANFLLRAPRPQDYDPINRNKPVKLTAKQSAIRARGFRQAVIEAYDCKCAVCGFKMTSPDERTWEVQAAHIVPHHFLGRDDLCNAIALCHLHHWAFDVGWFALLDDYKICVSKKLAAISPGYDTAGGYRLIGSLAPCNSRISLPKRESLSPHINAMSWHRQNVFQA